MMIFIIMIIAMIVALCLLKSYDLNNGTVGEMRISYRLILKPTTIRGERRFLTISKVKEEYYKTPCGEYCWVIREWLN